MDCLERCESKIVDGKTERATVNNPQKVLHSKKIMLSIWLDQKGGILRASFAKLQVWFPAEPIKGSNQIKKTLEIGHSIGCHFPPLCRPGRNWYSSAGMFYYFNCNPHDLTPSDYHLFRFLRNSINGRKRPILCKAIKSNQASLSARWQIQGGVES